MSELKNKQTFVLSIIHYYDQRRNASLTVDSITCYFHVLHFSSKLVNNILVNNIKKTAPSGGFPITHFLAKKRRESKPKDETTTRNKTHTAN